MKGLKVKNTVDKRLQVLSGIFYLTPNNIKLLVNLYNRSKEMNVSLLSKEVKKIVSEELEYKNKYQINQYIVELRKKKAIVDNKLHPLLDPENKETETVINWV